MNCRGECKAEIVAKLAPEDGTLFNGHLNLNDGTLEGMRHRCLPVFSVQYHLEASAGPYESSYLFEEFARMMA